MMAVTGRDGSFRLPGVPLGPQSLVVVAEDAGQEYRVGESTAAVHDLGILDYSVPSLRVRVGADGSRLGESQDPNSPQNRPAR